MPAAQEVSTSSDVAEAVDSSENGLMKPVEPEASEKIIKPGIPSQKKKPKFSLKNLFKKKGSKKGKSSETESVVLDTDVGEVEVNLKKGAGKLLNPGFEDSEDPGFDPGEISTPKYGIPLREIDVTYEVKAPFQYARVYFNGEELVHEGIEPPMNKGEKEYLDIIEKAFERMSSSEILIVDEKKRMKALEDRFFADSQDLQA